MNSRDHRRPEVLSGVSRNRWLDVWEDLRVGWDVVPTRRAGYLILSSLLHIKDSDQVFFRTQKRKREPSDREHFRLAVRFDCESGGHLRSGHDVLRLDSGGRLSVHSHSRTFVS